MHQPATSRPQEHGQSIFHYDLTASDAKRSHINECAMLTKYYTTAMAKACEAGSHTVAFFASALAGTSYAQSAVQMHGAVRQIEDIAGVELQRMRQTLETHWAQLSRSSAVMGGRSDGVVGANKEVEFIGGGSSAGGILTPQMSLHPHPSNSTQQSHAVAQSNHVDQKVKVTSGGGGGGGLRNFLSQFGAKRSDSQSSFYVPLDDGVNITPSTCGSFQPSGSVGVATMTAVDQSGWTVNGQMIGGLTSPTVMNKDETKTISSNANQFATQEDLDKVINMLSRSSTSNGGGPVKPTNNSASPSKTNHQQNVLHSTYAPTAPQKLNNLLHHHPSENGSDAATARISGIHAVQSTENRSAQQHSSLLNTLSHPLPQSSSVHAVGSTTNTWPYRPHEQSMWTGSDLLAMQSIFGRGPVDMSRNSISSTATTSIDSPHRGVASQATFTWPSNLNRFGGFGGNDAVGAVNLQRMYEGGNPWSSNRGGSFGTGDAWGSYFPAWNTDRTSSSCGGGARGVSTMVDSSSCSDESSNGEAVHWSTSTVHQPQLTRRRHSSGESGFPALVTALPTSDSSGVTPGNPACPPDPTSLSWRDPRIHAPLAQSSSVIGDRSKMVGGHRPLSMQYSDPTLNSRKTLSCWDRGATVGDKPHWAPPDSGVGTMNVSRAGGEGGGRGGNGGEHLDKTF